MELAMTEKLEDRLIEALKKVDIHGDVAPENVHDPMITIIRERVLRDDLVRWDDNRGRYVLTGTRRRRISMHSRKPATVIRLHKRGPVDDGAA
jgi:hypothetical protein